MKAALALIALAISLHAQSPTFEVATIKPNNSGSGGAGFPGLRNGELSARNVTMRMMLRVAYDTDELRIIGPSWFDNDRFDLAGKAPQGVPDTTIAPMLQALLKERFHLTLHRETRELPVFDMVVAKNGIRMDPSTTDKPFPKPPPRFLGNMNVGAGTMPEIALRLTGAAGRPVLDRTGLDGRYGFLVIYAPPLMPTPPGARDLAMPPDFFTAVEQQMGIRLEPAKEPVEVLVVDTIDRTPTEN